MEAILEAAAKASICACKGVRVCPLCSGDDPSSRSKLAAMKRAEADPSIVYQVRARSDWENREGKKGGEEGRSAWRRVCGCDKVDGEEVGEIELWCVKAEGVEGVEGELDRIDAAVQKAFAQVKLVPNFVSEEEEVTILESLAGKEWVVSQSGRLKQDYGPKANFKKKKLKMEGFSGLPSSTPIFYRNLCELGLARGFLPVEAGAIAYVKSRRSAIDAHVDDEWVWGEHLLTLSLCSSCIMSFDAHLLENGEWVAGKSGQSREEKRRDEEGGGKEGRVGEEKKGEANLSEKRERGECKECEVDVRVKVELPRRTLIISCGSARHNFTHAIFSDHIQYEEGGELRVSVTLRELSIPYLPFPPPSPTCAALAALLEREPFRLPPTSIDAVFAHFRSPFYGGGAEEEGEREREGEIERKERKEKRGDESGGAKKEGLRGVKEREEKSESGEEKTKEEGRRSIGEELVHRAFLPFLSPS